MLCSANCRLVRVSHFDTLPNCYMHIISLQSQGGEVVVVVGGLLISSRIIVIVWRRGGGGKLCFFLACTPAQGEQLLLINRHHLPVM